MSAERNRSLRILTWLAACALLLLAGPEETHAKDEKPSWTPATHRSQPATPEAGKRKAPRSLSYIYGEEKKEKDAEDGGDDGENTGGDGTGDASEDGGPDLGGVIGFDLTVDPIRGQASEFNAENLEDFEFKTVGSKRAPGNIALCICEDTPVAGFASAPGYGNNWDQRVEWMRPAPNPGVPTTVRLRFVYNHDTEPGRDFLRVELNRGGVWEERAAISGTNKDEIGNFVVPAIFDQTFLVFPNDYVGPQKDQIQLRLHVETDPHGSDEDGFFPSSGAAQIDEIRVFFDNNLISYAPFDFPPFADGWTPTLAPFVGDFLKLHVLTTDLDPCRQNVTHQFSFVDDGTAPNNAPGQSTGGSTSPFWNYGPGGFVVNYTGGLSGEDRGIHNELRTPAFSWDIPGPLDDPKYGAVLFFSVWKHLPLDNGLFYTWRVRGHSGGSWGPWRDHGFTYYEPSLPHYERVEVDVTTLVPSSPDSMQIALGVVDLAKEFQLSGLDATPSPMFDNIAFAKYPKQGPAILVRTIDLFQDAFPASGSSDWMDGPALSVRLDVARDINSSGTANIPGDSLTADIRAILPGSSLAGPPQMRVALLRNPRYNAVRVVPGSFTTVGGLYGDCTNPTSVNLRLGSTNGTMTTTGGGDVIPNRWSFDIPDGPPLPGATHQGFNVPLFFPGDQLHWYLYAKDTLGNVVTVPADTTGFHDFRACSPYSAAHQVRGLPTIFGFDPSDPVSQPEILVVDDTGRPARQEVIAHAMGQNGLHPGVDYDLYAVQGAGSGVSNGIGSAMAHGATAAQLEGYQTMVYLSGDQGAFLLSNGDGTGLNDKGDDIATLLGWRSQDGPRNVIYFGDNLVSGLIEQSAQGANYVSARMGILLVDADVRDDIDGQLSPTVAPTGNGPAQLITSIPIGACFSTDQFDAIVKRPIAGTINTHEFLSANGQSGQYAVSAGVWYTRNTPQGERNDVTFPFAFSAILDPMAKDHGPSPRSEFLGEVLEAMGVPLFPNQPTGNPVAPRFAKLLPNVPNPFNPATTVAFETVRPGRVVLKVYDIQGRRIATLLDEERPAGAQSVVWRGQDDHGAPVASGVYLLEMRADDRRVQRKMALVR